MQDYQDPIHQIHIDLNPYLLHYRLLVLWPPFGGHNFIGAYGLMLGQGHGKFQLHS